MATTLANLESTKEEQMSTYGEAIQDPTTKLGKACANLTRDREAVIAAWMAKGYSREQAYGKALGFTR
jgi:hypothetical protein